MEMDSTIPLKSIHNNLVKNGSWLIDGKTYGLNYGRLFDPLDSTFKETPTRQKVLEFKEYFFCGISPTVLNTLYKHFCKAENKQDLYEDLGYALLEIINGIAPEDVTDLDIHDPANWYKGENSDPHTMNIHFAIKYTLMNMSSDLHQQLIDQPDNLIRKRLVLMNHSLEKREIKIVKNTDPVFDQIDEELLSRVDIYDKEDMKARYIAIEELVEDLHDEFDPAYKKQKQEYAQKLITCIEEMNVEELKNMREFSSYNLENILKAKKKPKEWLYSKVNDWAIRREVDKIQGKHE